MTKTAVKEIIKKAGYFPNDELVGIVQEEHDRALTPKLVKTAFAKWEAKAEAKAGGKSSPESPAESEQEDEESKALKIPATGTPLVIEQPTPTPKSAIH